MADHPDIELDLDDVFPPPGARNPIMDRAPSTVPREPPMALWPGKGSALARLQEDIDLVIEATGRRLDAMERDQSQHDEVAREERASAERRLRELEDRLERTQRLMVHLTRKLRDVQRALDDHAHGIDEVRARHTRAEARIHELHVQSQLTRLDSGARDVDAASDDPGDQEPTMRVVRG